MSTLPNVPPVPDADRVAFLSVTSPVTTVSVPFPVYGTGEDLTVIVNYAVADPSTWTFSSPSGALSVLPLPITDGIITFVGSVIGTIEILGSWQPRQVIQPSAPGISRREFNQVNSMIISGMRELRRLVSSALQFIQTTAGGSGYFDARNAPISNVADATLALDAVNLETLAAQLATYASSGALSVLTVWRATGDGATMQFSIPSGSPIPAVSLSYIVSVNGLIVDPSSYTIDPVGKTITFTTAPVNTGTIVVRTSLSNLAAASSTVINQAVRQASATGFDTAALSDGLVYWNTPIVGAKTQVIPAANTAPQNFRLTIADSLGDSAINPIVIAPATGTINGAASAAIRSAKASLTMAADPISNNWVLI